MFPPAPAARSAVNFDSRGFIIDGKRTFLVSGGMEYARVPRALWRDRLLRLKRAGFNCVETYVFWNYHEPREGQFDFSGDHDLDAYLKLIHAMGMYAIVRVGPYCCAEWNSGGYPIWLRFKPGLSVREDNKPFEDAVDKFFNKMVPIVAANQINHGGSVILVQLENEYPLGWTHTPSEGYGTNIPNCYFQNLHDEAIRLGIQVPFFFSGMHHGSDPGESNGGGTLDDPSRPNPWITTEFWSVWFSEYGQPESESVEYGSQAALYSRRTWRIIANGGNGYNYYMAHGGSNFGYTNADVDAASYDYGAAVGQGGDLRPTYYAFKRAALFARSFQDILENSKDDPASAHSASSNPAVHSITRNSPAGTIQFLDNPSTSPVETVVTPLPAANITDSVNVTLAPGELAPIVSNFALCPGVRLTWAPTRILGIVKADRTTTLVVYGAAGSPADLHFSVSAPITVAGAGTGLSKVGKGALALRTTFAEGAPAAYAFKTGGNLIRILCVGEQMADRTWFVDAGGQAYVICGPQYVGDASVTDGHLTFLTEKPWTATGAGDSTDPKCWVYGPRESQTLSAGAPASSHLLALPLEGWQFQSAVLAPRVSDATWHASKDPVQMGADGDLTADAWYRTTVSVPSDGSYILDFKAAADRLTVFLDGVVVPQDRAPRNSLVFDSTAGKHILSVFVAHDGRPDFFPWLGPIFTKYAKGLLGPAILTHLAASPTPVTGWHIMTLPNGDPGPAAIPPTPEAAGWQEYRPGDDVFHSHPGFAWLQTTIVTPNDGVSRCSLHCDGIDNGGTIFLNGQKLDGRHGVNEPFDIPLVGGTNTVAILWENTYDSGGISPTVLVTRTGKATPLTGWLMRGGPGEPYAATGWRELSAVDKSVGPAFFRTNFTAPAYSSVGSHPIWRVVTQGLGHGSVWVNGHNLGRYPEKIPINGLYIPECWMAAGKNTLVIYDEDGRRPDSVTISAETAASRNVIKMVDYSALQP